jgi:hypothetical protein
MLLTDGLAPTPWAQVAELVTNEFFEQGDRERSELKLTPSVSSPDRFDNP